MAGSGISRSLITTTFWTGCTGCGSPAAGSTPYPSTIFSPTAPIVVVNWSSIPYTGSEDRRSTGRKMIFVHPRANRDWFVFGTRPNGSVDIADHEGDVLEEVPKELADRIVELRDKFLRDLSALTGRE